MFKLKADESWKQWVREMELDPNLRVVRNATGISDAFQTEHVYILKDN